MKTLLDYIDPRIFADTREIYGAKYFSSRNTIRGRVLNILEVVRGGWKGVSISRVYIRHIAATLDR